MSFLALLESRVRVQTSGTGESLRLDPSGLLNGLYGSVSELG